MAYETPGNPPISSGTKKAKDHKDWLEDVVDCLEMMQRVMRAMVGNEDGVLYYGTIDDESLEAVAASPVSMSVKVKLGIGFLDGVPFRKAAQTVTAAMTAPTSSPRIDTIAVTASTGAIVVHTGDEAAVPTAPSISAGELKLAEVYHRVGESAVYDADTSGEGYITDCRNEIRPLNLALDGVLTAYGGQVIAGLSGVTRGILAAYNGALGSEAVPGVLELYSRNGTPYYLFVEDDGTVRVSSSIPTSNTDGSIVGTQT